MREERIVPPSDQAAAVLRETPAIHRAQLLRPLSGERNAGRPMSENAVNAALYRVGFARTHDGAQLPGYGFDPAERNGLSAGCHRAPARTCGTQYLTERKKMMQVWADYLDGLRAESDN
jgi:hypothetical protein